MNPKDALEAMARNADELGLIEQVREARRQSLTERRAKDEALNLLLGSQWALRHIPAHEMESEHFRLWLGAVMRATGGRP